MAALKSGQRLIIALIAFCTAIELVLLLSDLGLIGPARLRRLALDYGGFWPGLLRDWQPNFAYQPYVMFLTHGFLHAGPLHLLVNMVTLWSVGGAVLDRVSARGFALVYAGALLGGGLGYGLLSAQPNPMVGASGALFGLVGAILAWAYVDRFTSREALWPVARAVAILVVLNAVLWWAMDGLLAWQTHLGGFMAGWVMALLVDPRPRDAFDP